jgi:hypothetical protein
VLLEVLSDGVVVNRVLQSVDGAPLWGGGGDGPTSSTASLPKSMPMESDPVYDFSKGTEIDCTSFCFVVAVVGVAGLSGLAVVVVVSLQLYGCRGRGMGGVQRWRCSRGS